jgi:hypothetical protein
MYEPGPFQLLQTDQLVLFVHEANHLPRFVYLDRGFPADLDPTHLGFSSGHWDGAVLVVETRGFQASPGGGGTRLPHSDSLHTIERLSLASGGEVLVDEMLIEDPVIYRHPWRALARFHRLRGRQLGERLCALPFADPRLGQ